MRLIVLLVLAVLTLTAAPVDAQIVGPAPAPQETLAPDAPAPGLWDRAMGHIVRLQGQFYRDLAGAMRALREGASLTPALLLIGLAFAYGVLHAAGPGHGKMVVSAYLLASGRELKRGISLAVVAAMLQGVAAVALVGILALALGLTGAASRAGTRWLEIASFGLIALYGAVLLLRSLGLLSGHRHDHGHGHGHGHGDDHGHGHGHEHEHHDHGHAHHEHAHHEHAHHEHGHHQRDHHGHDHAHDHHAAAATPPGHADCGHSHGIVSPKELDRRGFWALALAIGIRPCTGAILVMSFAVTQGILWAGVAATFAMAIGTAITVSALATLTVFARDLTLKVTAEGGVWRSRLGRVLAIGGSAAILAFGLMMLHAAWRAGGPLGM